MIHALIGPFPPPLGGISVFLYRRRRQLLAQGQAVAVLDYGKLRRWSRAALLVRLLIDPRRHAFDLNGFNYPVMAVLAMRILPGTITFRIHGFGTVAGLRGAKRVVFRAFLRRTNRVVLVNEALRALYASHGYSLPADTVVEPAFLPPPLDEEEAIRSTYDAETLRFSAERVPLLVANAFQLTFDAGVDLYGVDLCIELVDALRAKYPRVGLLIALAEIGDHAYFSRLEGEVDRRALREHVHFMTGQRQLWPLLKAATVLLRPTTTDGDAVSIREAQYFGRPVVASDAVQRPAGTTVFRSRDLESLVQATLAVLSGSGEGPDRRSEGVA